MLPALVRKWLNRPKRSDTRLLAQFFYADEDVTRVVSELHCLEMQKDPQHYLSLLNQLHSTQERMLTLIAQISEQCVPQQLHRREYQVKFPDELLNDNMSTHMLFAAELLVSGTYIEVDEADGIMLSPLAREVLYSLEELRTLLREQSLTDPSTYTESIHKALIQFDALSAEFELRYVSLVVSVKTPEEIFKQQEIVVLFCETITRALKLGYLTQDMIDVCEPQLMFTIPRLSIISGLLIYPDGPLNLQRRREDMSKLFSPFYGLLKKISDLLYVLSEEELFALEKSLCSTDSDDPQSNLTGFDSPQPETTDLNPQPQLASLVFQNDSSILVGPQSDLTSFAECPEPRRSSMPPATTAELQEWWQHDGSTQSTDFGMSQHRSALWSRQVVATSCVSVFTNSEMFSPKTFDKNLSEVQRTMLNPTEWETSPPVMSQCIPYFHKHGDEGIICSAPCYSELLVHADTSQSLPGATKDSAVSTNQNTLPEVLSIVHHCSPQKSSSKTHNEVPVLPPLHRGETKEPVYTKHDTSTQNSDSPILHKNPMFHTTCHNTSTLLHHNSFSSRSSTMHSMDTQNMGSSQSLADTRALTAVDNQKKTQAQESSLCHGDTRDSESWLLHNSLSPVYQGMHQVSDYPMFCGASQDSTYLKHSEIPQGLASRSSVPQGTEPSMHNSAPRGCAFLTHQGVPQVLASLMDQEVHQTSAPPMYQGVSHVFASTMLRGAPQNSTSQMHHQVPQDSASPMHHDVPQDSASPMHHNIPQDSASSMHHEVPQHSTSPMHHEVPWNSASPMHHKVPQESASPMHHNSHEDSASPMHHEVPLDSASAMHHKVPQDSASPLHHKIPQNSASPIHHKIPRDSASPMHHKVPRDSASHMHHKFPHDSTSPMYKEPPQYSAFQIHLKVPQDSSSPMYHTVPQDSTSTMHKVVPQVSASPMPLEIPLDSAPPMHHKVPQDFGSPVHYMVPLDSAATMQQVVLQVSASPMRHKVPPDSASPMHQGVSNVSASSVQCGVPLESASQMLHGVHQDYVSQTLQGMPQDYASPMHHRVPQDRASTLHNHVPQDRTLSMHHGVHHNISIKHGVPQDSVSSIHHCMPRKSAFSMHHGVAQDSASPMNHWEPQDSRASMHHGVLQDCASPIQHGGPQDCASSMPPRLSQDCTPLIQHGVPQDSVSAIYQGETPDSPSAKRYGISQDSAPTMHHGESLNTSYLNHGMVSQDCVFQMHNRKPSHSASPMYRTVLQVFASPEHGRFPQGLISTINHQDLTDYPLSALHHCGCNLDVPEHFARDAAFTISVGPTIAAAAATSGPPQTHLWIGDSCVLDNFANLERAMLSGSSWVPGLTVADSGNFNLFRPATFPARDIMRSSVCSDTALKQCQTVGPQSRTISSFSRHQQQNSKYTDELSRRGLQEDRKLMRREVRSRYHSTSDMLHRLFVCIAGVADQLQTNFASDLRPILKTVFEIAASKPDACEISDAAQNEIRTPNFERRPGKQLEDCALCLDINLLRAEDGESVPYANDPPEWVPDSASSNCMDCRAPFTLVRRRHHCRSCGKIFCSRCSAHMAPLPHFGHSKAVRVCNHCFTTHLYSRPGGML